MHFDTSLSLSKPLYQDTFFHYKALKPFLEITYASLVTIALLIISGFLLIFYPIHEPSLEEIQEIKKLFCQMVSEVAPKPKEHFILMSLYCLFPIFGFISIKFVISKFNFQSISPFVWKIVIFLIPILMTIPFIGNIKHVLGYPNFYMDELAGGILKSPALYSSSFLIALIAFVLLQRHTKPLPKQYDKLFISLMIILILFQTFSSKIFNIYGVIPPLYSSQSAYETIKWWSHLQVVFYPVNQVMHGMTLLADLMPQYGFYAELLKPLFLMIGLSILKFSTIFSMLQAIGIIALFFCLRKFIKRNFLIFLCISLLCLTIGFTWIDGDLTKWDPTYQFSPIRFFFPATSVLLFSIIAKKINIKGTLLFSFLSGIAIIWNLDSGFPVFGAFMAFLISLIIFPNDMSRKKALTLFIICILMNFLTIFLFIQYLTFKSGLTLNLSEIIKYQRTFYVTGFGMMPITRGFAPWHIICSIYVFGIMIALYSWFKLKPSLRWNVLFFLSVLGLGLFPYHQGRSHVYTLIAVSWPAYLIAFIMADYIFRVVNLKQLPNTFAFICLPIVIFGVLSSAGFFYITPALYQRAIVAWKGIIFKTPKDTILIQNLEFIKSHIKQDKEVVILGFDETIYHVEADLYSPLKGPADVELLLKEDEKKQIEQLKKNRYKHIFVRLEYNDIPKFYAYLLDYYDIIDKNPYMMYLTSKFN